ncbi:MAG: PLP-dependent aspartate aminotransferase family protein [Proteobacteria bacterium]|nr:PLP-dependent aspartate aminotransferase family protein [Pseudomonadota bacterium]
MRVRGSEYGTRTLAVHAGGLEHNPAGAIAMPIFRSSTYELGGAAGYDDIVYGRLNNTPNHRVLAGKLAALERAEAALATASGMAAVATALLSHLRSGDHLIAQEQLYGGTRALLGELASRHGIETSFVADMQPRAWRAALRARTKVFYVEAISNPLVQVAPLDEVVRFAREHELVSIIDNTFATPINFQPIPFGFDLVVHSATKYLNGHTDVVAGVVAGAVPRVQRARHLLNLVGACLDPHACFLLQRGLMTLPLRVPVQNSSALALARTLGEHPEVEAVHYPGLADHGSHDRARAWFKAGFGAVVSFVPRGGLEAAEAALKRLKLARVAPSLGGVETLVCRPANTSHAALAADVRRRMGVSDGLVRVSIGIEDPDDLVADFSAALGP